MGIKNLWRRKLRTSLTILGVVIGTASIVVMMSLGFGMNESFKNEISRMGSLTEINVMPGFNDMHMGGKGMTISRMPGPGRGNETKKLDEGALAEISKIKGVVAVSPYLEDYLKIIAGRYVANVPVVGVRPEAMEHFGFVVTEGRILEEGDGLSVVFGSQIKMMFYNEKARPSYFYGPAAPPNIDLLKDRLVLTFDMSYGSRNPGSNPNNKPPKLYRINGVGILREGDWEKDYYVFMPIEQLKKIIEEKNKNQGRSGSPPQPSPDSYQRVKVKVNDMKNVQEIQNQIKAMGFNAHSLTDFLDSMKRQFANIQALLGGIGAISLFVAAIGITNTMVMSIYERTREIGVMKVIGATFSDIRKLFLFEAAIIGFAGGVIGIALSFLISYMMNSAGFRLFQFGFGSPGSKMSLIPLWLVPFSIGFSTLVGVISGFYPALRAMKLSALEAIRTE
jgi:ABC-type antimicrobial peptide transport system permease subunit